jgi:CP family cyanate transporter-like MFS transporter
MESGRPLQAPWLIAAAVVALGLILRGPIIAVAPVVGEIQADLGFTAAQVGLLTSVPVLGVIVRSVDGAAAVVAGTLIIGAFITVGNVVVPVLIRREVAPERARLATALYSCSLNLGSVLGTFVTAPLADLAGWRVSLGWWALFTLAILALWLVAEGRRGLVVEARPAAAEVVDDAERAALRRRDRFTAALLSIAFVGQAFAYYGVSAWMPTVLEDRLGFGPTEAGSAATVFQLLGIAGSIGVPLFARRIGLLAVTVTMGVTWLAVPLGLLFAPQGWLAWSIIGGVAQGAGISLVFILVVEIARDGKQAGRLSAVSQGVGYGFGGATAPTVLGALHDATGAWDLPLILIALALLLFGSLITWTVVRAAAMPAATERAPA